MKKNNVTKKITVGSILTFVLIIACLTTGLALSFHKFTQNKPSDRAKSEARSIHSALNVLNIKLDGFESSEALFTELALLTPNISGVDTTLYKNGEDISFEISNNTERIELLPENFKENTFIISDIETNGTEISFTYYTCLKNKIYAVAITNGEVGEPVILCKNAN